MFFWRLHAFTYQPFAQREHAADPETDSVPSPQSLQNCFPGASANFPAAQGSHEELPLDAWGQVR